MFRRARQLVQQAFAATVAFGRRRAKFAARLLLAPIVLIGIVAAAPSHAVAQSSLSQLFDNVPTGIAPANQPASQNIVTPPQAVTPPSPPRIEGKLPLQGAVGDPGIEFDAQAGIIHTLIVRDASLSKVIALLAQSQNLNIVAANDIDAIISITLREVPVEEALTAVLDVANYTWVRRNNIILITSLTAASNLPAETQGRQVQVFELDFAASAAVSEAIAGMLSPVGKSYVNKVMPTDNRRTRELIVVEDVPNVLQRVASYVAYVDQPPRQVLIEAHIFTINLKDTISHGINLNLLLRAAGSNVNLKSAGLASASASPAFLATVDGGDFGSVIECLQNTTDAKTLGAPRLLVLNGQEAMFHVGDDIGYQGSQTTTQTSTFQNVQFLEVGVVLRIVPQIARDGRVMLHVEPEVSSGQINTTTNVPDKSTTELKTDVMLYDGQGMVIGGLIKENDSVVQTKIPYLGNVKGIGWFFRKSTTTRERQEIIIAVQPRVQPYEPIWDAYEQGNLVRAGVPLWHGPLHRNARPWDPVLPNGYRVSVPLIPQRPGICEADESTEAAAGYIVPPYPLPQPSQQRFDSNACPTGEELPLPSATTGFLSDDPITPMAAPIPLLRQPPAVRNVPKAPVQKSAFINDR